MIPFFEKELFVSIFLQFLSLDSRLTKQFNNKRKINC